ncbi:MauE/DoxX family redox-associated membrane protein [Herbihabitans rhizosphaerae]|uniref:MauE/DoxX family redox-associated membrane protein n=1 Tax=Herbihabitans rhizosphaerae TaxID=1872711 RepID=UPI00102AC99E|nr:MauE/DoxX family redox-associated membrane protein [Herbihabitans rhizosphaerae]
MDLVARLGLAVVLLVSGVLKIADPGQTYLAVRAYDVLPDALVRPAATVLPLAELALGALLLIGLGTRVVAVLSVLLLVVLTAGVAQAWARGLSIDCGCFGGGGEVAAGQTEYPLEIARDLVFLAMAGWLVARPRSRLSVDGVLGARAGGEVVRKGADW